jgi:RNA polymerase sigma factor FliA
MVSEIMEQEHWDNWKKHRIPVAGDYLVEKYSPLVNYVVQHFSSQLPSSVQKDELISYAYEGLLDAIEKYDDSREIKFETYASWRIKGAVIDALRSEDHVSRSMRSKVKKIERAFSYLEQEKQRTVSIEEVSEYLQIDSQEINRTLQDYAKATVSSIDQETTDSENQPTSLVNIIEDDKIQTPHEHVNELHMKQTLAKTIEQLPEKEKLVVSLYYFEELKFNEIAEVLEVSVPRISQLHSRAITRLQGALEQIEDFIL